MMEYKEAVIRQKTLAEHYEEAIAKVVKKGTTMDMIEKIEIEDMLKNHARVRRAVQEVAVKIAVLQDMFKELRGGYQNVELDSFTIEHNRDWIMAHVSAEKAEQDDEESIYGVERYHRSVYFPLSYMTSTGWEEEAAARGRDSRRWIARYDVRELGDRYVRERERELAEAKASYVARLKLAAEPYEVNVEGEDSPVAPRYTGGFDV